MDDATRRFVGVVLFEAALVVGYRLWRGEFSSLVIGVAVVVTVIEASTWRLARSGAADTVPVWSTGASDRSAPTVHRTAGLPGVPADLGTQVGGSDPSDGRPQLDLEGASQWDGFVDDDDPASMATAFTDVYRDWDGWPFALALHDEARVFDEDELEDGGEWSVHGPLGDTVLAQPEIEAVERADREVVLLRAAPGVTIEQVHAAGVRAILALAELSPMVWDD